MENMQHGTQENIRIVIAKRAFSELEKKLKTNLKESNFIMKKTNWSHTYCMDNKCDEKHTQKYSRHGLTEKWQEPNGMNY